MKTQMKILAGAIATATSLSAFAIPISVDVITVVDESGSMGGEHAWIDDAILSLNTQLIATAAGDALSAKYGLVGYGASPPAPVDWTGGLVNETDFATATGSLRLNGGTEDGYDGMDFAFTNFTRTPGAALNIILVTDEDRDVFDVSVTKTSIMTRFNTTNALLNAVVNCQFADGTGARALGIDSKGNAYVADGAGGFTTSAGGQQLGSCAGTTNADYVSLAIATGGAAWDLNLLRAGGLTGTSFTSAFVDIKVGEIVEQQPPGQIPEPGSLALLGLGAAAIGFARKKKAA